MRPCEHLDRYLDGALDGSRRDAFTEHLAACGACDATVRRWREAEAELRRSGRAPAAPPPSPEAVLGLLRRAEAVAARPAPRVRTWAAAAAVGTLALAATLWWTLRPAADRPAGPGARDRSARAPDAAPRPGAAGPARRRITAESARVALPGDRGRLAMAPGSVGWVAEAPAAEISLGLTSGLVAVDVDPGRSGPPVRLAAGPFRVHVVGTRFLVRWTDDVLVVAVTDGTVEVSRHGQTPRRVPAGQALRWPASGEGVHAPLAATERERIARLLPPRPSAADAAPPAPPVAAPAPPAGRPVPAASGREQGRELLLAGRLADAEAALRRHLAHAPADAEGWSLLGDALRKAAQPAAAVLAYERVTALGGPRASRARFLAAALVQDHLGQPGRAAALLRAFLDISPAEASLQAEALWRLARAQLDLGQRTPALATLRRLVEAHGGSAAAARARQRLLELERGAAGGR